MAKSFSMDLKITAHLEIDLSDAYGISAAQSDIGRVAEIVNSAAVRVGLVPAHPPVNEGDLEALHRAIENHQKLYQVKYLRALVPGLTLSQAKFLAEAFAKARGENAAFETTPAYEYSDANPSYYDEAPFEEIPF